MALKHVAGLKAVASTVLVIVVLGIAGMPKVFASRDRVGGANPAGCKLVSSTCTKNNSCKSIFRNGCLSSPGNNLTCVDAKPNLCPPSCDGKDENCASGY